MPLKLPTENLYEQDFELWLDNTIALLKLRQFEAVDLENLIEELLEMGRRHKRELKSRLVILLMHLLKWQYQPDKCSQSWIATLNEQRRELAFLLQDSPSLKSLITEVIPEAYDYARKDAARETRISLMVFPEVCPFTQKEILDSDFFPENELKIN